MNTLAKLKSATNRGPGMAANPMMAFAGGGVVGYSPTSGEQKNPQADQSTPNALAVGNGIMADMNNLGKVAAQPGQGAGASYNWNTQSATEQGIAAGINPNAAYRPGAINDPLSTMNSIRRPQMMAGTTPPPQKKPAPQIQQVDPLTKGIGFAHGGKIKGPGTPTSDSIPAKVQQTGEPIKVSTGERIVSAAQDRYLTAMAQRMGFDSLDAMLEAGTGQPVGPTIKGGQRAASNGAVFRDDLNYDQVANGAPVPPAAQAQPAGIGFGQSPPPTIYGNGGLPAPVVQAGIEKMRGQMATPPANAAAAPTDPSPESAPMVIDGVRYGPAPTKTLNPLAAMVGGYGAVAQQILPVTDFDAKRAANRAELDTTGQTAPATAAATAKPGAPATGPSSPSNVSPAVQGIASGIAAPPAEYRKDINATTWNTKDDVAAKTIPTKNNPKAEQPAQGTGIVSIRQNDGSFKNVAIGPQNYTAADGSQTSDWSKTAQYAEGMARAASDRDRLAAMQRDRFMRDSNPETIKDPRVIAAARQGIGDLDRGALMRQSAEGVALDTQAKRDALAKSGQINQMVAELSTAKTPEELSAKRANILAAQGKNPNEHRFFVGEDEATDPMGAKTKKAVLLDALAPGGRAGQPSGQVTSKEEVAKAISTGKITKEQAAERIKKAGGNPKDYGL